MKIVRCLANVVLSIALCLLVIGFSKAAGFVFGLVFIVAGLAVGDRWQASGREFAELHDRAA